MILDFAGNNIIKELAKRPYWTVNIDNKKPLDIKEFQRSGKIRGACDDSCLTDLSSLLTTLNVIPKQLVYSLDAARDNIAILDIEKTCPDDIKNKLLDLPFLYGDISMSGRGYHMAFPCPALDDITIKKVVMKEEHSYYEILLRHYVTFTENTIFPRYTAENAPLQFQQIWDKVYATQKNIVKADLNIDINANTTPDFPMYESLKSAVLRHFRSRFDKTPTDYGNDMSRYEFAVISSIRYSLNFLIQMPIYRRHEISTKDQILTVYNAAIEIIPYREKHKEIRQGMPMLLYQTYNNFASSINTDNNK